ncbi:MAG TPA: hypothetical protein VFW11_14075 [Cyclobacteriaceae bacterium]|nr:hypothetical protein [Cyclobacteriaceae bacterium]
MFKILLYSVAVALIVNTSGRAQGLAGKLKQKAKQLAEKTVDKKVDETVGGTDNSGSSGSGNSGGNHPSNNSGGGLISTPPDVKQNLTDAETSYKSKSYGEARYSVQQAMLGVELEIGHQILKSLPESVSDLPMQSDQDQVTSTGWGWVGLTIKREYLKGDKELTTLVANNSAWMSAVNMYLTSGGYAQSTGGQQNWKQTKVKGYRAVIEYNEGSGYKLSVPVGQSSLIVWEAVNFANEQEVMTAANAFDIDGIKKMLGEQ